jgi:phosphoserine phosphatase RsbU/P
LIAEGDLPVSPNRKTKSNALIRISDVLKAGEKLNADGNEVRSYFLPGLEVSAGSSPAGTQGGDFHGIVYLDRGCSALFIGDIAGHDFSSSILATSVLKYIEENQSDLLHPHLFLRAMNRDFFKELSGVGRFFTAAICVADTGLNLLSYSSAGHPPGLLFRKDDRTVAAVGRKALPLGFERDLSFPLVQTDFYPGDMLLLYTDGISGARSASKEEFGQLRLETLLKNAKADTGVAVKEIFESHNSFSINGPETDDRMVICALRTL